MRRLCIAMCVVTVLAAGCEDRGSKTAPAGHLSILDKISGKHKTSREKHGLIGPVHTVKAEKAAFVKKSGKWVEGPRRLASASSYRRDGKPLEHATCNPDGSVKVKIVFAYDANGKDVGLTRYRDGVLVSKSVFKRDAGGRLVESLRYDENGVFRGKNVHTNDSKGKHRPV